MARTVEQVLRDYLGDQVMLQARMMAELEMLRDEVKRSHDDLDEKVPTIVKPNGHDPAPEPITRPNGHG